MVKFAVCLIVLVLSGVAISAPAPQEDVQVLRYENDNKGDGNYVYTYELSNGQIVSEAGGLSSRNGEDPVVVVSGSYTFVAPDGITYWVNYTADEDGFHPMVGQGPGGIKSGDTSSLSSGALKSLVG